VTEIWTAPKTANRLNKIVEAFCVAHGGDRFPVDVVHLALEAASLFGWGDPITAVQGADIPGFDGCLSPNDDRSKWLLLYNDQLSSPGRIRFTQAHELGHYILHRLSGDAIRCSEDDMLDWSSKGRIVESQADQFASYLLMPLDDYRKQVPSLVDLEVFQHCSERYGVSFTAAILKWLDYTDDNAVLIRSTDGFINWSCSSSRALKAGAFLRTRNQVIPVPCDSLAGNISVKQERRGADIPAKVWFKHAEEGLALREMKISSDHYGSIWSLLHLPRNADVWPPRSESSDEN
jgi:hypothetical protein